MRVKNELEIKIHEDIQSEIMKYYDWVGVEYRADENEPEKTIIDFFPIFIKGYPC